ncbi:hypothetical protein LOK49_LG07G01704 [Camellia lanceoleosa]|uniref:Uncharacterized protein n=1 Tax=Camellia lanceoleosa TaxID=1840588 RepID=A0ACC0H6S8_9ERIC|nr:hypothetical protein LOK49_LG07G01704 [Camellia lanceoleosa]
MEKVKTKGRRKQIEQDGAIGGGGALSDSSVSSTEEESALTKLLLLYYCMIKLQLELLALTELLLLCN